MVPFAPLEDAEEPEPCHKMELYVSGGEVSVGPGGGSCPRPRPATRRHLPARAPPPPGAAGPGAEGGRTATPPASASPRRPSPLPGCAGLPPPRLPAPVCPPPSPAGSRRSRRRRRRFPASLGIPPANPPARLPGAAARPPAPPPGHLACSRLVPWSSRTGTGLSGSSLRLRPVPGRRRPPGATRSPSPPPREGPSPRVFLGGCGRRHRLASRREAFRGSEGGGGPRSPPGCGTAETRVQLEERELRLWG